MVRGQDIDCLARRLERASGIAERSQTTLDIVSSTSEVGMQTTVFERKNDRIVDRCRMALATRALTTAESEIQSDGTVLIRKKLEF